MDPEKFNKWWRGLSRDQQNSLLGLETGDTLPADLVPSLIRYRGSVVPDEWWATNSWVSGFPLPADVRDLVRARG